MFGVFDRVTGEIEKRNTSYQPEKNPDFYSCNDRERNIFI